jgi:hypothetical protein
VESSAGNHQGDDSLPGRYKRRSDVVRAGVGGEYDNEFRARAVILLLALAVILTFKRPIGRSKHRTYSLHLPNTSLLAGAYTILSNVTLPITIRSTSSQTSWTITGLTMPSRRRRRVC